MGPLLVSFHPGGANELFSRAAGRTGDVAPQETVGSKWNREAFYPIPNELLREANVIRMRVTLGFRLRVG